MGEAEHQRLSCHSPLPAEVKRELRHLYTSSGLMRRFWPMFRDVWAPDHPRYFDLTDLMRGWGRPPKLSTCPSPHRLRRFWWCRTRHGILWRETGGDGLLRCGPLRLNWTLGSWLHPKTTPPPKSSLLHRGHRAIHLTPLVSQQRKRAEASGRSIRSSQMPSLLLRHRLQCGHVTCLARSSSQS